MPYKYVRARGGGKIILSASFEIKKIHLSRWMKYLKGEGSVSLHNIT